MWGNVPDTAGSGSESVVSMERSRIRCAVEEKVRSAEDIGAGDGASHQPYGKYHVRSEAQRISGQVTVHPISRTESTTCVAREPRFQSPGPYQSQSQ